MYAISREFQFEAAHRLRHHKGACKNIHGHSYKMTVTIFSKDLNTSSMLMDFGDLKYIVNPIIDKVDHSIMVSENDDELRNCLYGLDTKIYICEDEPTVEVISKLFCYEITRGLLALYIPVITVDVEIYETEKCNARYTMETEDFKDL